VLSFNHPIRLVAAAAAVLALAAPAAQARPADLAARHQQMLLGGSVAADTARPGGHKVALGASTFAVGSASTRSSMMPTTQLPPDRVDKIGTKSHFPAFVPSVPIVVHTTETGESNGFGWNAAVIGAGSVLGLALLGGAAMGLRGRRRVAIS
jgi:hypothetical protein